MDRLARAALTAAFVGCLLGCCCRTAGAAVYDADETPPAAEPSSEGNPVFSRIPHIPGIGRAADRSETASVIQVLFLLTVLTLAPSILLLMTCFTRIVIVLGFLRRALATQTLPPNQIVVGLSLFLTLAIMSPVFAQANRQALQPYLRKEIGQEEALKRVAVPFRRFMLSHTRRQDLQLFVSLDKDLVAKARAAGGRLGPEAIPTLTLVPAFVLSEMKVAFWMGFLLYLPFLIIDLVVASVLMSMGMMFLPPIMVSMPFKLLLFVLVDGWHLVVGELVRSIGPVA